jgi:hypothetical protein
VFEPRAARSALSAASARIGDTAARASLSGRACPARAAKRHAPTGEHRAQPAFARNAHALLTDRAGLGDRDRRDRSDPGLHRRTQLSWPAPHDLRRADPRQGRAAADADQPRLGQPRTRHPGAEAPRRRGAVAAGARTSSKPSSPPRSKKTAKRSTPRSHRSSGPGPDRWARSTTASSSSSRSRWRSPPTRPARRSNSGPSRPTATDRSSTGSPPR